MRVALTVKVVVPLLLVLGLAALLVTMLAGSTQTASMSAPSDTALSDIPPDYLALYVKAGQDYETDWWVLAAIGRIETDHGRSKLPGVHSGTNAYGAAGPMQFGVGGRAGNTWGAYGVDGNADGVRNVYDPADAIPAAANYTRANGAPADWRRALFRYNHSEAYVDEVLAWAQRYRTLPSGAMLGTLDPSIAASKNISTAGLRPAALLELRNANSFGLHLISGYRQDPLPEHPSGLALDISNGYLTTEMAAYAESLRQRGKRGEPIHGVIYNNQLTGYGNDWTWRRYSAGYTGNPTQDHKDHVHVWMD